MSDLARIVYISRATFNASSGMDGCGAAVLHDDVAQILATSRADNQRDGLVGMLYYRDGCFIQCIEGERRRVHGLYRALLKDRRHRDLKLLVSEPVDRLAFPEWPMKFVPDDKHMHELLAEHGFERFDPYRFDHFLIERVLQLMQAVPDPTANEIEPRPSAPARNIAIDGNGLLPLSHEQSLPKDRRGRLVLCISLLALGVSLANLAYIIARF